MSKNYNEIPVKDNMKITNHEEVEEVKEKKKLDKLVSTQPKKMKRGLFNRLVTGILGPEGIPGIGSYVNDEIIKPAIKNIIVDAVTSGINMVMYGDRGQGGNRGGYNNYSRSRSNYRPGTNYGNRYQSSSQEPERKVVNNRRYDVEEFVLESRIEASEVLASLSENADRYDSVSVADYYDLIGVASQYTDNNYGWTIDSISRATIIQIRGGGYVIKFPPVEVL